MPAGDAGEAARYAKNASKAPVRKTWRDGPKPKHRDDPVVGFIKSATKFVGQQIASDARGAAKVYRAVDKYGKERQEALLHPRRYAAKHPNEQQSLDISPAAWKGAVAAGKLFLKPGSTPFNLETALEGVPKSYGKKNPWKFDLPMHLPEAPPPNLAAGVGGRIPWLVHNQTGRVAVGNLGESHAEVGAKLANRGIHVSRRTTGSEITPVPRDEWLEGWIHPVNRADQPAEYAMHLSARGLDTYTPPASTKQLEALVKYITRDLTDKNVTFRTRPPRGDAARAMMAARQGEARMASLESKIPEMTEEDFLKFLEAELLRRRKH